MTIQRVVGVEKRNFCGSHFEEFLTSLSIGSEHSIYIKQMYKHAGRGFGKRWEEKGGVPTIRQTGEAIGHGDRGILTLSVQ